LEKNKDMLERVGQTLKHKSAVATEQEEDSKNFGKETGVPKKVSQIKIGDVIQTILTHAKCFLGNLIRYPFSYVGFMNLFTIIYGLKSIKSSLQFSSSSLTLSRPNLYERSISFEKSDKIVTFFLNFILSFS